MKLIYLTSIYGGRVSIYVQYSHRVYFEGVQPPDNTLILLDLPNLKSAEYDNVLAWLKENNQARTDSRREINEFPDGCWQKAVLDDYLEAENYNDTIWQLYNHFLAEDFDKFGDKWISFAQMTLKNAVQKEVGVPRIEAFDEIRNKIERVYYVLDKIPHRLNVEIENMRRDIENAKFAEIKNQTDDLKEWIKLAGTFKSHWSIQTALDEIGSEFKNRRLSSEEILSLLKNFGSQLRQSTSYPTHPFWSSVAPLIRLEQNLTSEEVDITETVEEKAVISWDLLDGKRVGTIIPGRNVLAGKYQDGFSTEKLYVSGERKLKFQVQQKGGKLEKFGCTLTMESQEETKSIQPALLEVEKIDALANLNIDQALEKIAHLNLPKNHIVYYTAEKAKTDPRQARVLSDLLIELLVGVDADIARNLARAQSRGNRK